MNKHAIKTLHKQKLYTPVLKYNLKKRLIFQNTQKAFLAQNCLRAIALKHISTQYPDTAQVEKEGMVLEG